jgi:hypothetical protein
MLTRVPALVTTALILGMSVGLTLTFVGVAGALGLVPTTPVHDWEAYYDAAIRLTSDRPLFPSVPDPGAADTYRYPPWFAAAWIPFTLLPRDAAAIVWVALMYGGAAAAVYPLLASGRRPAILLAALFLPFLVQAASNGNVHPLLVALLVHGVDRRWGPLAVGVSASLKGFPLLYAVVYAIRGEWRAAFASAAIAVVLTVPILLVDLSNYPWSPGPLTSLWLISPIVWAAGAIGALVAVVLLARRPAGWFAASVAIVLSSPRLLYYDMTFLLVTSRDLLDRRVSRRGRRNQKVGEVIERQARDGGEDGCRGTNPPISRTRQEEGGAADDHDAQDPRDDACDR